MHSISSSKETACACSLALDSQECIPSHVGDAYFLWHGCIAEFTKRRGRPRIQGRRTAQEGEGDCEEEGVRCYEGDGQGNSQEGRRRSPHTEHDAQAFVQWQAWNGQDRPSLSAKLGMICGSSSATSRSWFLVLFFCVCCCVVECRAEIVWR